MIKLTNIKSLKDLKVSVKEMKRKNLIAFAGILVVGLFILMSCSGGARVKQAKHIVISEIMASNRTGLLNHKGKTWDWIELKNTSSDSINLEGFQLAVVKMKVDSVSKDTIEDITKWEFPDVTIKGNENLIVFADKKKVKENKGEGGKEEKEEKEEKEPAEDSAKTQKAKSLRADFNLPKDGGTIQFLAPNGDVITEVTYGKLAADQAYVLQDSTTYVASYFQSPGFDNTPEGVVKASEKMDEQRTDPLKIWEVMSRSADSADNWVELKNTGNSPLSLAGYSLSKKLGKNEEYMQLPSRTLQPGEIVTIQLSGRQNQAEALQAPFKIGKAETVILSKDGKFVDGVCAKATPIGGSIGRTNGKKGFFYFATPTRNADNGESGKRHIVAKTEFDKKPGVYPKENRLVLHLANNKNRKVHYTTDGSEPTLSSPVLNDSLILNKGMVVRTLAEGDSTTLKSPIGTHTYIMGVDHKMPVINVAVNKSDMYDYNNGIYVDGPGYNQEWPHKGANYWKKMIKKAHVEMFDDKDGKEGFATDCGLKIFGGFSRAEAKKSFCLKFKGMYGNSRIEYDFFDNGNPIEVKDLVLRSGSQDYARCMVRDEFFTSLMKSQSPELLTQVYRPVALYINAEYFGLYYIREKIDKHFVSRQLNVPTDSINIIMSIGYNEEGPKDPYNQLMQYAASHDMTNKENYEYMKKNVDLLGLIDYKIGEIYSGNTDVGNIRYVRSTHPDSDKKWHFVFYDLDASWVGLKPPAAYYLSTGAGASPNNGEHHNRIISRLLANPEFRDLFLQRLSHHLTHTISEKNATAVFDNLVAKIKPEMKRNCERWPQLSYETWEKNISEFRDKFKDKPKYVLDGVREYLHITDAEHKKYFAHLGY